MENKIKTVTTFVTPYGTIKLSPNEIRQYNYFYKKYGKMDKRLKIYKEAFNKFVRSKFYLKVKMIYGK